MGCLLDGEVVVGDVGWFDEPVGEEPIDGVGHDGVAKIGVSVPFPISFQIRYESQDARFSGLKPTMPFLRFKADFPLAEHRFAHAIHGEEDAVGVGLLHDAKIKRYHVLGRVLLVMGNFKHFVPIPIAQGPFHAYLGSKIRNPIAEADNQQYAGCQNQWVQKLHPLAFPQFERVQAE